MENLPVSPLVESTLADLPAGNAPDAAKSIVASAPRRNALLAAGIALLALAALLLSCGLCATLFYVILPLRNNFAGSDIATNTVLGSLAGVGVILGVALGWQGLVAWRGREPRSAARAFPPVFVLILIFGVALGLGLVTQNIPRGSAYLFPPWHILASSIPPLAFVAYAAHRLGKTSHIRALAASFTWGALGATFLALILELLVGVIILVGVIGVMALIPNGQATLEQWQGQFAQIDDAAQIMQLASNPVIVTIVLGYIALIVPIIEETVKTLLVAFMDPRRTTLADAILWGMSAGAGFAVIESALNGSGGLDAWALTMLTRVGATVMHVGNGVTMGRGWYAARVEGRWGRLALAFGVSVLVHALWNAVAIIMSGSSIFLSSRGVNLATLLPAGVLTFALAAVLVLLATLGTVWIVYSVRTTNSMKGAND